MYDVQAGPESGGLCHQLLVHLLLGDHYRVINAESASGCVAERQGLVVLYGWWKREHILIQYAMGRVVLGGYFPGL